MRRPSGESFERAQRAFGTPWPLPRAEYNRRGRQGYLLVEIEKNPWNLIHHRAVRRFGGPTMALGDGGPGLDRRRERGNPAVSSREPDGYRTPQRGAHDRFCDRFSELPEGVRRAHRAPDRGWFRHHAAHPAARGDARRRRTAGAVVRHERTARAR